MCQNGQGEGRETLQLWSLLGGDAARRVWLQPRVLSKVTESLSRFWGR